MEEKQKKRGRPIKLTDEIREKLIDVMQKNPLEVGLPYSIWDKDILKIYYDWKKLGQELSKATFQSVIEESKQRYGDTFFDENYNNVEHMKRQIDEFAAQGYHVIYADVIFLGKKTKTCKKPFYHIISTVDDINDFSHISNIYPYTRSRISMMGAFCDYLLQIIEEWYKDGYHKLLIVTPNKAEFKKAAKIIWEQKIKQFEHWRIKDESGYRWVYSKRRSTRFENIQVSFMIIPKNLFKKDNFEQVELFKFVKDNIEPYRPERGVSKLEHERRTKDSLIKLNADKFIEEHKKLAINHVSVSTAVKRFNFLTELYQYSKKK